jgi:hypothetical protein
MVPSDVCGEGAAQLAFGFDILPRVFMPSSCRLHAVSMPSRDHFGFGRYITPRWLAVS